GGAQKTRRLSNRYLRSRTALSFSRSGIAGGAAAIQNGAGSCLGAGRASQYGRNVVPLTAIAAVGTPALSALGKTLGKSQPRHRLRQRARTPAEDFAFAGIHQSQGGIIPLC